MSGISDMSIIRIKLQTTLNHVGKKLAYKEML